MSHLLKYLKNYEEKETNVIIHLKDFPSSKIKGKEISRELYSFLFNNDLITLDRIEKINDLTYSIQK